MHQMKLFKGVEAELAQLETEINHWLTETGAKVISMNANIAPQTQRAASGPIGGGRAFDPSDVLIAVVYETG